ncbi:DUF1649 family protein [Planoprotostelium fungivorum]|uniref:Autophagy-related protein 101 n=1 Tax=Planoprotostelium fungivorum TaxID=1890364 RepID=A0A2P6NUX2_9EUKA|nr:DUF1649 family protein [Planoprotostelium fungivorum]
MNTQQFPLEEVTPKQLKEVLQCLLHTIIFNRTFGVVRPKESVVDFIDFTYVKCDDESIEKAVSERAHQFYDSWLRKKFDPPRRAVVIAFDERRYRSQLFGFSKVEEKIRWENWILPFSLASEQDKGMSREDLQRVFLSILRCINDNKNHIPPLTNNELVPFPYEIYFPSPNDAINNQGIMATLGSMLKGPSSAPSLLLT